MPNVRTCVEPLREGLRVERQEGHAHPKLDVEIESRLGERRNLIETDILVVGAGPAGMCAAIEAAQRRGQGHPGGAGSEAGRPAGEADP